MSSPKALSRRALLLGGGAAALLSACGFAPLHEDGGIASYLSGRMAYVVPETTPGYRLRQALRHTFGEGAEYTLRVDLSISATASGQTPSGATLRYTLLGQANYTLSDGSNQTIASGTVDSFTGYSASASSLSTALARTDAEDRLAALLADRITRRLLLLPTP